METGQVKNVAKFSNAQLSQDEARAWLERNGVGTIRDMARRWGWPRSNVERFVNRWKQEQAAPTVGQGDVPRGTDAVPSGTDDEAPFDNASWDDPDWEPCIIKSGDRWIAVLQSKDQQHIMLRIRAKGKGKDAEVSFHVSMLPDLIRPLAVMFDVFMLWRADCGREDSIHKYFREIYLMQIKRRCRMCGTGDPCGMACTKVDGIRDLASALHHDIDSGAKLSNSTTTALWRVEASLADAEYQDQERNRAVIEREREKIARAARRAASRNRVAFENG